MQFQVLTVVRLMTPDPRSPDGPDDDRIQAEHIAYLRGLGEQGKVAVNGPIRAVDSPTWRGLTVYRVGVRERPGLVYGVASHVRDDGDALGRSDIGPGFVERLPLGARQRMTFAR